MEGARPKTAEPTPCPVPDLTSYARGAGRRSTPGALTSTVVANSWGDLNGRDLTAELAEQGRVLLIRTLEHSTMKSDRDGGLAEAQTQIWKRTHIGEARI